MARGDQIRAWRGILWHHGVDCGDGWVIHYTARNGKLDASIRRSTITEFASGDHVEVVEYSRCDHPELVVARAESRLGERGYNLVWNNCEHFARWCKTGVATSEQVDAVKATGAGSVGAGTLAVGGVGVVGTVGSAAGLGGAASTMHGLATVGGTVGGGAAAGVGVLATAPTLVAGAAMFHRFKDDSALPDAERRAREAGRAGTVVGATVGVSGALATLYASGTVGLSAVGISTGLASIGGAVGGGMLAGAVTLACAPAALAALVGYAVYRLAGGRA